MTQTNDPDETRPIPRAGRLLGIDYGTVRIGIAICDEGQAIASPYENYNRRNEKLDEQYFIKLIDETNAVGIVVGLPLHMSGDESEKSGEARAFGKWLAAVSGLPVSWIDERFSTAFARELLSAGNFSAKQKKARLDKVAAQAILATYLDSSRSSESNQSID